MFRKIRKNGKSGWRNTWLFIMASVLLLNIGVSAAHRTILQQGIAEEVLRFHVLANSDEERDQEIKYMVRDAVLEWLEQEKSGNTGADGRREKPEGRAAAEHFLKSHLDGIERIANQVLREQKADYRAEASLTTCYFPDRTYGDCTFPAGWYQALRIRLGEARGHNWWCVLYPELCFSDCLHAVVSEKGKEDLKRVLSAEEYESLLTQPGKWKISFRWF